MFVTKLFSQIRRRIAAIKMLLTDEPAYNLTETLHVEAAVMLAIAIFGQLIPEDRILHDILPDAFISVVVFVV